MSDVGTEHHVLSDRESSIVQENVRLRSALVRMQTHVDQVNRLTCVLVLERILDSLASHYEQSILHDKANGMPLTDPFYVLSHDGAHLPLPDNAQYIVESLWMGRIESASISFGEGEAKVSLHPSFLREGRPLVQIADASGNVNTVVQRHACRAHSFVCKNHPQFPGMIVNPAHIFELLEMLTTREQTSNDRIRVSQWPANTSLDHVASVWLGRATSTMPTCTLYVDNRCVQEMVDTLATRPSTRIHFVCYGQEAMQAYILLTADDGAQTEVMRVPVGSV